jgi:hypothetical protein
MYKNKSDQVCLRFKNTMPSGSHNFKMIDSEENFEI